MYVRVFICFVVFNALQGAQPCKSAVAAARAVAGLCVQSISSMAASILLSLVIDPFETDDLKVSFPFTIIAFLFSLLLSTRAAVVLFRDIPLRPRTGKPF
jgi:hypothetical protein